MLNTPDDPTTMANLTHLDNTGQAHMVDVTAKAVTPRRATAQGQIRMSPEAFQAVRVGNAPKGDVLGTARLAAIMAAKKTSDLIPLCHPLPLGGIDVVVTPEPELPGFILRVTVKTTSQTGVEMEALTAVSIGLLTLYDMAKALDKTMTLGEIHLVAKEGGRSGDYRAE
ncbi:cyclic pyranopterin monophosphate synthase MoaC [Anthocerotibacter panamensis]|uniref:cyclic pyranopterin monophosphate synthase MoaC n=1 Tax=Anthocerotibacter panamensis TaxID=2857077 RepID=UPI002479A79F|nr:cyclic pyranopterin monophosphate synthase MoaC [Anthocerotibacter panamensis]